MHNLHLSLLRWDERQFSLQLSTLEWLTSGDVTTCPCISKAVASRRELTSVPDPAAAVPAEAALYRREHRVFNLHAELLVYQTPPGAGNWKQVNLNLRGKERVGVHYAQG